MSQQSGRNRRILTARRPRRRRGAERPGTFVRFASRRLASLVLLALGITLVAFVLTALVPGDPARSSLGPDATPAQVKAFDERYGLDQPLPVQYVRYLEHLVHGDLGESQQTQNPVTSDLAAYLPATAELALFSVVIATVVGIGAGLLAALSRDRPLDYVMRVVSLSGVSVPVFFLALITIYVLFFQLAILPGGGRLDVDTTPPGQVTGLYTVDALLAGEPAVFVDALRHLLLPAAVLSLPNAAVLTRYTRSAVLEIIDQDYVRAARAKGLPRTTIVFGHILRAALPALITVVGLMFASVMTGAVLIENIFSWPGVGRYGYQAATTLDLPAIMGVSLFVAVVYITINFVVDLLYGVLDPRIRVAA